MNPAERASSGRAGESGLAGGGRFTSGGENEKSGSAFISRILFLRSFDIQRGHLSDDSSRSRLLLAQDATITRSYPSSAFAEDLRPGGPFSCSVLHRVGFILPPSLLSERWALTPPFHPYPPVFLRTQKGGLFSVTLSIALGCPSASDACARHAALWCPDFPLVRVQPKLNRRATTPADPMFL